MKNKLSYLFLVLFFIYSKISYSQQPSLTVYYSYSEKSRDSHSTVETFSLNGDKLSYAFKYTGSKGPNQKDESRISRLSNDQVNTINSIINKYHLNVSDSVVDNSNSSAVPVLTTTIMITTNNGDKTSKIKVKGDIARLEDNSLYSNSAFFAWNNQEYAGY